MMRKTLTITEDAYNILARQKRVGGSFSQEIVRLLDKKGSWKDYAGAWAHLSDKEIEAMHATVRKLRKSGSMKRYHQVIRAFD